MYDISYTNQTTVWYFDVIWYNYFPEASYDFRTVHPQAPQITPSGNTVWYLFGESPPGYPVSVDLTSSAGSNTTWSVVAGSEAVNLSSTTGATISVTASGSAESASIGDIRITASVGGSPSAQFQMTVLRPARLVFLTDRTNPQTSCPGSGIWGYETNIYYTVNDQLEHRLPENFLVNEEWFGGVTSTPSNTDWVRSDPLGRSITTGVFADHVAAESAWTNPPVDCGNGSEVQYWSQHWFIGSTTPGRGAVVQIDRLWKGRNHGEHR